MEALVITFWYENKVGFSSGEGAAGFKFKGATFLTCLNQLLFSPDSDSHRVVEGREI